MAKFKMYQGEDCVIVFSGILDEDLAAPSSSLASAVMTIVDSVDTPVKTLVPTTATITDAAKWEFWIKIAHGDVGTFVATDAGLTVFYTVKCTAADGTIIYLPVDSSADPEHGEITIIKPCVVP